MAPSLDQNLSQNTQLNSNIPSQYAYFKTKDEYLGLPGDDIPVFDYSLYMSGDQNQRSTMIQQLGKACLEWRFFYVINHTLPESLTNSLFEATDEFFKSPESKKVEHTTNKDVMHGIRVGSNAGNASKDNYSVWRNYMKMFIHPDLYAPNNPPTYRETLREYNTKQREIAVELLKGISLSLGQDEDYINRVADRENGTEYIAINSYPPCPQPEVAVGAPPHTDFGLLIFLMQNGAPNGLQIERNGKWYNAAPPSNSIMVLVGDQLEMITNGKYKSIVHRVTLNTHTTRMSFALVYGPSYDNFVAPAPEFVDEKNPPLYRGMKYADYYTLDQTNKNKGRTTLDKVRITNQ